MDLSFSGVLINVNENIQEKKYINLEKISEKQFYLKFYSILELNSVRKVFGQK
jgi:hypothetical protein